MRAILELAAEKEAQRSGGKHVDLNAVCDSAAEKIARAQMPTERVFFILVSSPGRPVAAGIDQGRCSLEPSRRELSNGAVAHAINNMP